MPGFYTNRSKSYNFNIDYTDFPATKSITINDDTYFFGQNTYPVKNSFFTTNANGERKIGLKVDGRPNGMVSDGYGGFYIYGEFTYVNGKYRVGIAHLNSSGQLTEWNAGLNSYVYGVRVLGSNVYIGGSFTSVKGVTRNRVAALSLSGQLLTWNPNVNDTVFTLTMYDVDVYIGGSFTSVGGTVRNRLAAINTLGTLLNFNPNANGNVYSIVWNYLTGSVEGTSFYVGGDFTSIGLNARNYLAECTDSSSILSWNPSASGRVRSIRIYGTGIYIGGDFTSVNGNTRNYLAAVNTSANVLAWNPNANGNVHSIFTETLLFSVSSNLYVSGSFELIGGSRRDGVAIVNTSGTVLDYNINTYTNLLDRPTTSPAYAQKVYDNIYVYKGYESGEIRFNSYKLTKSGEFEKFINIQGSVNDAVAIGDNIYIGGNFTKIGGSYSSFSTFSTSGSDITNIFINNENSTTARVSRIFPFGIDEFYITGSFQNVNQEVRTGFAHINSTGNLSSLSLDLLSDSSRGITSVVTIGDNIYIGGQFSYVNGVPRNYLAAINTSGKMLDWNPNANGGVLDMKVIGNDIYIAGWFTTINGNTRNRLAAVNTTGNVLSWNPNADNQVFSMQILNNNIYAGGWFTTVNGNARNNLVAINIISVNATGNVLAWNPSTNAGVCTLAIHQNVIYAGGDFTTANGNTRRYLAAFDTTGALLNWNPSASSFVYSIAPSGSNIYVAGNFTSVNGNSRGYVAAINTVNVNATGNVLTWNPNDDNSGGSAVSLAILGTNVYVGWSSPKLFGATAQSRYNLAAINTSGSILTWNPSASSEVSALVVSGSNIYIGGGFYLINGNTRSQLAAVNTNGNVLSWLPNLSEKISNDVRSLKISGDNIYIGGDFISYGFGSSVKILKTDNSAAPTVPAVDLAVQSVLPDAAGGYYVGGAFTVINGNTRNRLAYINSSGAVTSWNPNANSTVYGMGIIGTNLYVGGAFTEITGNVRNRLAAISTVNVNATGNVLAWNPSASAAVYALTIIGDNIYVGGDFSSVNGNTRTRAAGINTVANVIAWDPNVFGNATEFSRVWTLKSSGSNIYIGGKFVSVAGTTRYNLALVNTAGTLSTWNPNVFITDAVNDDALVYDIAISGSNVYIGGYFDLVGGSTRNSVAAINTAGTLLSWGPNVFRRNSIDKSIKNIAEVRSIAVSGDNVYFGGEFDLVNDNVRYNLAAVNTSGSVLNWNPTSGVSIRHLSISGTNIYVGASPTVDGIFAQRLQYPVINGTLRYSLAAVNTAGNFLSWNPSANANVSGLAIDGNNIYAYGKFTNFGVISSYRAIGENSVENSVTSVLPEAVMSIVPDSSGGIYIGGAFTWVDGIERNRLAHINSSGSVTSWNPNVNAAVDTILISGTSIYIGGEFTSVFSNTRNRLAALSTVNVNATGNVLAWNPNANGTVYSMGIIGVNIYIGGAFTSVNNNVRNYLAAVNTTANVVAWNPSANGNIYTVAVNGVNVYVGGAFTLVNGNARGRLAGINTVANVIAWAPSANSDVYALAISGDNIYIGGAFTIAGGLTRRYLLGVNTAGTFFWNPSSNGNVYAIAISGTNVYVGGDFTIVGGNTRNDVASIDAASAAILSWNPSSSAVVCSLAVSNAMVYIGTATGATTSTGPKSNYLGVINTNASMAGLPKINLKKSLTSLAISGNNLYISGTESTTTLLDTANYLYTTNEEGKVLRRYSLTKGITNNGPGIYDFAVDASGGVYISGEFGSVDGIRANNIAYINSSGSVVSWGIDIDNVVHDIAILGDNIYVGGAFTKINGNARNYIGAVSSINANAAGNVLTWNPSANANIYDIDISNNIIYIAGAFTLVNGNTRNRLAAINTSSNVLSWNPNANALVVDLKILGSNVYIDGEFTSIGSTTRRYLAAINTVDVNATGNLLAWNPSSDSTIYAMDISGTNIYVGGFFTLMGGNARTNFAAINTAGSVQSLNVEILFNTGNIPEWYSPAKSINCINVDGSNIYVSGLNMQIAGGQLRPGAFAVNTSGNILSFLAIGNWIPRIKKIGDKIFVAPTVIGSTPIDGNESVIPNFVTLDKNNLLLKSINIDTDMEISDITIKDQSLVFNSGRQVFDGVPSYRISDERSLNAAEQGLE